MLLKDQVAHHPSALVDEDDRPALSMPVTSIYTRTDGVAPWQDGLQSAGPLCENIEVFGSHCGLAYNPAAVFAVADRLAQPDSAWQPFRPPSGAGHWFPEPAYWQSAPALTSPAQE